MRALQSVLRDCGKSGRVGSSNKKGAEMLNTPDQEAKLVFAMTMKLGGGEDNYSEYGKAEIWAECVRNPRLRNLALQYIVGSSSRAELNLYRLHTAIAEIFFEKLEG